MKRNRIVIKREWMRIGNTFTIMVDLEGHILSKQFRVESIEEHAQSVIELNKKLKEFDLIEQIKRDFNVKKVVFE